MFGQSYKSIVALGVVGVAASTVSAVKYEAYIAPVTPYYESALTSTSYSTTNDVTYLGAGIYKCGNAPSFTGCDTFYEIACTFARQAAQNKKYVDDL